MRSFIIGVFFILISCRSLQHLAEVKSLGSDIKATATDSTVEAAIQPYRIQLTSRMEEVIGQCSAPLTKGLPESPLGNFFCDALVAEALSMGKSVDGAIQNYGGLRIPSIAAGPVTVGKIFELMPFDNIMVILIMTGAEVDSLFQAIAADDGWPVSKDIRFVIEQGKATLMTIKGQPLEPKENYRILMPDYVANGYNRMYYLTDNPRENTGVLIRDAIISHVRKLTQQNKAIQASVEGRITVRP